MQSRALPRLRGGEQCPGDKQTDQELVAGDEGLGLASRYRGRECEGPKRRCTRAQGILGAGEGMVWPEQRGEESVLGGLGSDPRAKASASEALRALGNDTRALNKAGQGQFLQGEPHEAYIAIHLEAKGTGQRGSCGQAGYSKVDSG